MDVSSLKNQIKARKIDHFLIFSGLEWQVQKVYIDQIVKVTGKEKVRVDSISDIYSKLKNRSFVQKSCVYILRDDKEIMTNEKLQQQLQSDLLGDNILILLLTNVDKRTKFYKAFKASIIEFETLSDAILEKYIKKEINLSQRNIERLIDICERDYGRILLEIDKIHCFMQYAVEHGKAVSHDECFVGLIEDGTIYQPPYDAIFDLVDAILDRKVNRAFDLLQQAYAVGEATLVILSVLYNNAKAVLQVQTYRGKDISKGTGLSVWQIKKAREHCGKYSEDDLIYIVQLVQKIESGIKSGAIEESFAIEYLLVHIL